MGFLDLIKLGVVGGFNKLKYLQFEIKMVYIENNLLKCFQMIKLTNLAFYQSYLHVSFINIAFNWPSLFTWNKTPKLCKRTPFKNGGQKCQFYACACKLQYWHLMSALLWEMLSIWESNQVLIRWESFLQSW